MPKKFLILYLIAILLSLSLAGSAQAALVPCGGTGQAACTFCDFLKLAKNVIDWLVGIASTLAVAFIVWGGFVIMMAGGSPEKMTEGRKTITIAVTGLIIVFGAWLIIGTLFNVITGSPSALPWNSIQCR
ncbi:MAG: pilin [bacterium]|nr:pilin [bacterium]